MVKVLFRGPGLYKQIEGINKEVNVPCRLTTTSGNLNKND